MKRQRVLLALCCMLTLAHGLLQTVAAPQAECRSLLAEFTAYSSTEAAPYIGDNMVYFLHIPRTAGRTFLNCLLQLGTPAVRRCNKTYDQRINGTDVEKCYMLSSHDDFSIMQQLPPNTAVVSQFRDPVQRVLSAYEFALEGAAQQLQLAKDKQQRRQAKSTGSKRPRKAAANQTSTLRGRQKGLNNTWGAHTTDVWPWTHLIPYLADDLTLKVAAARGQPMPPAGVWTEQRTVDGERYYWNEVHNTSKWELSEEEQQSLAPNLDPYNNSLAMPLLEFIRSPIAAELLHNGELLQVLGLTNYSTWPKAAALRSCMQQHKDIADELLQLGLKRIERFTHVGTLDHLNSSVEAAAASLNMPLNGTPHLPVRRVNGTVKEQAAVPGSNTTATDAANRTNAQDTSNSQGHVVLHKLQLIWQQVVQLLSPRRGRGSTKLHQGLTPDKVDPAAGSHGLTAPGAGDASEQAQVLRRRQLKAADPPADPSADPQADEQPGGKTDSPESTTTPRTLGEVFSVCAANARRRNQAVKDNSIVHVRLNDRRQIFFDKEDRQRIPQEVLDEIRDLNALDVQLYERALELLDRKRQQLSESGALQALPVRLADDDDDDYDDGDDEDDGEEDDDGFLGNDFGCFDDYFGYC